MQKLDSKEKLALWKATFAKKLETGFSVDFATEEADKAVKAFEERGGFDKPSSANLPSHEECLDVWRNAPGDASTSMHVLLDFIAKRLAGEGS